MASVGRAHTAARGGSDAVVSHDEDTWHLRSPRAGCPRVRDGRGRAPLSLRAGVPRAPATPGHQGPGAEPEHEGPQRGPYMARRRAEGADALAGGRGGSGGPRARRAVARGREGRGDRQAPRQEGLGLQHNHARGYERSWRRVSGRSSGRGPASELTEVEWQAWVDRLARQGMSRTRIANHVAVVSAIYSWASRPSRRPGVARNPMPRSSCRPTTSIHGCASPRPRRPRSCRRAQPDDPVPYALAFYAGLRRGEIHRLDWQDVELDGYRITSARPRARRAATGASRSPSRCGRSCART